MMIDCKHHWHSTGRAKACHPPINVMVCCHCGVEGWQYHKMVKPEGCGAFVPAVMVKDGEPRTW